MKRMRQAAAAGIAAMGIAAEVSAREATVTRPASLGVQENIVFLCFLDRPRNTKRLDALWKR